MDLGPAFYAALDTLPEPMLLAGLDGLVLAANPALAGLLEQPRQALAGLPLAQLCADAPGVLDDYLRRCARSGQFVLGAVTLCAAGGKTVRCRAAGAAFRPADHAAPVRAVLLRLIAAPAGGFAFIALNDKIHQLNGEIARRQLSETTLSRERETLQVTLASIGDAVIVTDAAGRITFLNGVAEALVGYRLDQARGQPLAQIVCIADELTLQPAQDPVESACRGVGISGQRSRTVLIRPDGRIVPIDNSGALIRLQDVVIGAVIIFRDMSAHRRSEEALREADRRKDEFLATLAHELRNPLAPIRNAMQLLGASPGDEGRLSGVRGMVERQIKHMVRLIDDLMDVARITRGQLDLRREPVALDAVIQIAVESSRPLLEGKRQNLHISLDPAALHVDADVTRLAQVFSNLLNNAAKYSPPGAEVRVRMQRDGGHAVVTVTDEGIGIPAHALGSIFDMFVQLDRTGTREGLGIGLTLVKRIVELHGGSVEAASGGAGAGSTFRVRLAVVEPRTAAEVPAALHPEPTAGGVRILVADDNRDAAQTLALILELAGHEVHTAYDGAEALQMAEQFRPQVALLDIGMPRLDGYQTARRLREHPWGRSMLLVAITGWGQAHDRRQSHDAGFDRHLVKPVDPQALKRLIEQTARR
ncbi:MAG TPA: ATP-binding protein [Steroidobacteraceae bacterium]|jgi:PAS domain S-box-containing protein|nr:ATP-binding protein [Steroidobacteraceae bacterium]